MLSCSFKVRAEQLTRPPVPPRLHTSEGAERRVGVEIELTGLELETIAAAIHDTLGGTIERTSPFEIEVVDTEHGSYRAELDQSYLKRAGRREALPMGLWGELERLSTDAMAAVAKRIVPLEVVTPPIPISQLPALDALWDRLRSEGALGTHHSALYAFGTHLNPECPDTSLPTLGRYLQAFLCLYEWLSRVSAVDSSRRVTPYIDPFPREYLLVALERDYEVEHESLIDDYLRFNPTRNRALDMLPVLSTIAPDAVKTAVDDPRIKARPALHYRLPNCELDRPGWSPRVAWRHWLQVEHLAHDRDRLREARTALIGFLRNDWARASEQWLVHFADEAGEVPRHTVA